MKKLCIPSIVVCILFACGSVFASQSAEAGAADTAADKAGTEKTATTKSVLWQTHLFQVTILRADTDGATETKDVLPKNVSKAIADVTDFLPFKSYRLLDAGLVRLAPNARMTLSLSSPSWSNGPEAEQVGGRLLFRVTLTLGRPDSGDPDRIQVVAFEVVADLYDSGNRKVDNFRLIDTTFDLSVGETVVVGSSKLGATSKAVVVLLTAPAKRR